jgi:uncharacterized protein (DUF2164 family)
MSDIEKEKQAFEEIVTNFEDYLCNVVGLDIDDFDAFMSEIARRYSDNKNEEIAELKEELEKKNEAIRKIANMSFDEYHPKIGWMHHYKGSIYEAVGIARNVLGYSLQGIIPQEEHEQALQGEE